MPRRVVALGPLLAALGFALGALPHPPAVAAVPDAGSTPSIELVTQTPVAAPGGSFVATVLLDAIPADGSIAIDVHSRIRSRSELAQSMEGEGLRGNVFQTVVPVSALPPQPDGTRRIVLSLNPAAGGLTLPAEGVYPLELTAKDAAGNELASLVTHLIVPPDEGDDAPNLAVAVVAEVRAPFALQPDGSVDLPRADVQDLAGIVAGLTAAPSIPATLSVQPETVEALLASEETGDAEVVAALRTAASGRTVLADPYVPLDLDALAAADLLDEVGPQQARGVQVLADELGVVPEAEGRLAQPTLGAAGLEVLAFTGTTRMVVDDAQVAPLPDGVISYSLAQPFELAVPEGSDAEDPTPGPVLAMAPDPVVMGHLAADESPGLVVSRVIAELALIRLEQPSVARSSVVALAPGVPAATVQQLLAALGTGRPFEAVSLAEAFDHAEPVEDGGGNPVERALVPQAFEAISPATARSVRSVRADLGTFRGLVGVGSSLPELPSRHLLVATGADLTNEQRRAQLGAAAGAMNAVDQQVSTPPTFTLTLTAREGTIPLTIRNDSGVPVRVSIHLSSAKLEFPDGDTIDRELVEETTRIDIRVRSRATGAFPLRIDVRTPDDRKSLSMSRYTVRSTAVSGVGLVLSVGAGVFLTVWWARHWHRTRRSKKLIATDAHPSSRAGADAGGQRG